MWSTGGIQGLADRLEPVPGQVRRFGGTSRPAFPLAIAAHPVSTTRNVPPDQFLAGAICRVLRIFGLLQPTTPTTPLIVPATSRRSEVYRYLQEPF